MYSNGSNELPDQDEMFRIIMLTSGSVWKNNLTKSNIIDWLSNFSGEALGDDQYEKRLALWLLTNFVYINTEELRFLCKYLLEKYIHSCFSSEGFGPDDYIGYNDINRILSATQFVCLGQPSESGSLILYYFRQENSLRINQFQNDLTNLPKHISNIAFIDDVTLTGSQAKDYLDSTIKNIEKNIFLLTIFSTQTAKKNLRNLNVEIISSADIDSRCYCFKDLSSVFHGYKDKYKQDAHTLALTYGLKLKPNMPLGYKKSQLLLSFDYNTPDNTLPIFWVDEQEWIPLFKRYEKESDKDIYDEFGTFI